MSCVLRAWGEAFDVSTFFEDSPLQPDAVYEKGDASASQGPGSLGRTLAGFNLKISDASADHFDAQINESILFLDQHEDELRRLGSFPGVEGISLEFGVPWRDAFAQTETFPSDLLWRAGALDISLQITHYSSRLPSKPLD